MKNVATTLCNFRTRDEVEEISTVYENKSHAKLVNCIRILSVMMSNLISCNSSASDYFEREHLFSNFISKHHCKYT